MICSRKLSTNPQHYTFRIFSALTEAFNACIPDFNNDSEETHINIVLWWLKNFNPDILEKVNREIIKEVYVQYKSRKNKLYQIHNYLSSMKENKEGEKPSVKEIMEKLKIHPKDLFLKVYILLNM